MRRMAGRDELRAQWADFAAEWIARISEGRDDAREGILDDYADEGPRSFPWPSGHVLTGFHRTMGTMLNTFLRTGFVLRGLHEPTPTPEQLRRAPANDDLFRVPIFVIYDLAKV